MTRSVRPQRHGMVQWAPKGSYRLPHVLAYLRWAIGEGHAVPEQPHGNTPAPDDAATAEARARARAASGQTAEVRHLVVVLDWFAPHLDERVDDELGKAGAVCLRIAGGLTGDVQVCDTHRHGPLTACYREIENRDSRKQLRLKPHAVPSFSRQDVFDRSMQTWAQTSTGVDGRKEWVQNACLNALNGSEDGLIARDLLPLWLSIDMPALRDQLRDEIQAEVQAGRLHSFMQLRDLLEPYDDHEGIREGMEDAETHLHADDEGASTDDEVPDRKQEQADMDELPQTVARTGGELEARASGAVGTAPAIGEIVPAPQAEASSSSDTGTTTAIAEAAPGVEDKPESRDSAVAGTIATPAELALIPHTWHSRRRTSS